MPAEIRELRELRELRDVAELFAVVWGRPGEPPVSTDVLRAMAHSGSYIAGAYAGGRLIGGIAGWIGMHAGNDLHPLHLHSHILGVLPADEAKGLGSALKFHQRLWCLERGIGVVEWTFDPLVRRNAYFNLNKLGAEASEYLVDFYGRMQDGINAGDESDRILIRWELESEKAEAAAAGRPFDSRPTPGTRLVQVPEDIVAIRRRDAAEARRWRHQVRESLGGAMSRGYRVTGFDPNSGYLLELDSLRAAGRGQSA